MMVDAGTRALVWRRAQHRCEYCQIHQDDLDFLTFHVEHIIPRKHAGSDDQSNLCLSCPECNAAKGANLTGLLEGKVVPLFHPRRQVWSRHFRWDGAWLVGITRAGKVTVDVLNMNDPARIVLRESLHAEERFPPRE
jgi:hypothetical protein